MMSLQQLLNNNLPKEYRPQLASFEYYLTLLKKWNKAFNLTAIEDENSLVDLHILDSLSINEYLVGENILDVGSGAGLPGIPLAITNPNKKFTLLDGNGKKTRFLTQAKIELALNNVTIINARIEDFHPQQKFSTITCRAFSSLERFYLMTHELLKHDGVLLAMKGQYPKEEISILNKDVVSSHVFELNNKDYIRHLVVMKKL